MAKTLQERVQHVMDADGFTVGDLARASGKTSSSVSQWLSGLTKTIKSETAIALAKETGYTAEWWATGMGPMKRSSGSDDPALIDLDSHPDLVPIRTVKLRLQAGVTGFAVENDETEGEPLYFRAKWLQAKGLKPNKLVVIKVMGQSMEPTLYQGDVVVANTADTEPKDGKVFAINYEGEAVIKRMVRDNGTWWLTSDNPDIRRFPRKECADGGCIIVGRIVHRQSEEI